LTNDMLHHNVDYAPYEGKPVNNWPRYTIIRGQVVWDRDGGGVVGQKNFGQFVKRQKSSLHDMWDNVDEEGPFDLESL
jgi:dihydropyrimidinase